MKTIGIIFLLFLVSCNFTNEKFKFGEKVKISDVKGYTKCVGNVRNYLGFGYFQVDAVWCDFKRPGVVGGESVDSFVVSDDRLTLFWWQTQCSLGFCYTPVSGTGDIPEIEACKERFVNDSTHYKKKCIYKQYFNIKGEWVNVDTGTFIHKLIKE